MKTVKYKEWNLAKGSQALELLDEMNKASANDKAKAKAKLDAHLKDVERRYKELMK
jgi:hypothetical protein